MKKLKKKSELNARGMYFVTLWDTYTCVSGWKSEEDFNDFVDSKIVIELVGWYYKENEEFYYFYSMGERDCDTKDRVNHASFLSAVPKKAIIEIVELGKRGKKK